MGLKADKKKKKKVKDELDEIKSKVRGKDKSKEPEKSSKKKDKVPDKKPSGKKVEPEKNKKVPPKNDVPEGYITTQDVADELGITPKSLRVVLREHFAGDEKEGYTRYSWKNWNDQELKRVMKYFANRGSGKVEKVEPEPKKKKKIAKK